PPPRPRPRSLRRPAAGRLALPGFGRRTLRLGEGLAEGCDARQDRLREVAGLLAPQQRLAVARPREARLAQDASEDAAGPVVVGPWRRSSASSSASSKRGSWAKSTSARLRSPLRQKRSEHFGRRARVNAVALQVGRHGARRAHAAPPSDLISVSDLLTLGGLPACR